MNHCLLEKCYTLKINDSWFDILLYTPNSVQICWGHGVIFLYEKINKAWDYLHQYISLHIDQSHNKCCLSCRVAGYNSFETAFLWFF